MTDPPAPRDPPPPPPSSLGVYIHWPYCARICPYCDFNVVRDRGRRGEQAALARAIADDLRGQAALTGPRTLVSIYLGGGTPSLMDPAWAGELIALARALWTPAPDLEVTLEANPTDAETDRFCAFAAAGAGRLSLGVQALDDAGLTFLGRNHDAATARRAARLGAAAFPRLSLDLIYALPGQTWQTWACALGKAVGLGAEHLSPYQLTIEPGAAFARAVRRGRFAPADPDLAAALYETTQAVLEGAGFHAYEVSNHARGAAARARHNLVYWRGHDYVGAGPGAHGRLTVRARRSATRAHAHVADYVAAVERTGVGFEATEPLDPRAQAEERLLMGLRTDEGVAFTDLRALDLRPDTPRIADLADEGFLTAAPDRIVATPRGRLLLDAMTARLVG